MKLKDLYYSNSFLLCFLQQKKRVSIKWKLLKLAPFLIMVWNCSQRQGLQLFKGLLLKYGSLPTSISFYHIFLDLYYHDHSESTFDRSLQLLEGLLNLFINSLYRNQSSLQWQLKNTHFYVSRYQSYECICAARPQVTEGFSVLNQEEKPSSSGSEDHSFWE